MTRITKWSPVNIQLGPFNIYHHTDLQVLFSGDELSRSTLLSTSKLLSKKDLTGKWDHARFIFFCHGEIHFLAISSLLMSPSRALFLLQCFWSPTFLFDSFLPFPYLCLHYPSVSWMLSTFSIKAFSTLIIVLKIPALIILVIADSGFKACSAFSNHIFCLLVYLVNFVEKWDRQNKRNCRKKSLSNVE